MFQSPAMSVTTKTAKTFTCNGCGVTDKTEVTTASDVPILPKGWLLIEVGTNDYPRAICHICPACIGLIYFESRAGGGVVAYRADTPAERGTLPQTPTTPPEDRPDLPEKVLQI